MSDSAHEFFRQLLETPSPSGYEQPVQELVREYVGRFADDVRTDVHGNVIACKNPDAKFRLMLAGHCDQIGMLVSQIDDDGFVYAQTIGGWDPQQLIGQRMTVWTRQGAVPAVIARKAIHLLTEEERKQVVKTKDLWLDMGATSKNAAEEMVRIGDPITLRLGYQDMQNGLANSPGMDDKTGVWVVVEALRRAIDRGVRIGLFAVSTVQEEIGLRGAKTSAHGIDPHAGIAVDVTHATDCPTIDRRQHGEIKLGRGPVIMRGPNVNPVLTEQMMQLAESKQIPFQLAASGRALPNDANSIQITRDGVATGAVAIPNRYMHSAVEMISLEDINNAAELLAELAVGMTGKEDFTP